MQDEEGIILHSLIQYGAYQTTFFYFSRSLSG